MGRARVGLSTRRSSAICVATSSPRCSYSDRRWRSPPPPPHRDLAPEERQPRSSATWCSLRFYPTTSRICTGKLVVCSITTPALPSELRCTYLYYLPH
jgi:hypothetical protein